MAIRIQCLCIDSGDPARIAAFWESALGWRRTFENESQVCLEPPEGSPEDGIVPDLLFLRVPENKTIKNRCANQEGSSAAIAVRMMNKIAAQIPADLPDRHPQRIKRQFGPQRIRYLPADNPAGEQIGDERRISKLARFAIVRRLL